MKQERWDGQIVVDAGDLFYDKFRMVPDHQKQATATARFIVTSSTRAAFEPSLWVTGIRCWVRRS